MAGHSKWAQIKRQKGAEDAKRGQLFSKVARAIILAARSGDQSPETNQKLKAAIEKARSIDMPKSTIEGAIAKGISRDAGSLEEFLYEAYGPEGSAFIVEGITDSKNRTTQEIKHILAQHGGKLAMPGATRWLFDKRGTEYIPKARIVPSGTASQSIQSLIEKLETHDDVQNVYTNVGG